MTITAFQSEIKSQWFHYQKCMDDDMTRLSIRERVTTTADFFEHVCTRFSARLALIEVPHHSVMMDEVKRQLTYGQMNELANRVAWWAHEHCGIRQGDVVALLMENCNAFVYLWAGLAKAGATVACLSTHVRGQLLEHAISVSERPIRHIIVSSQLVDNIPLHIQNELSLWVWNSHAHHSMSDPLNRIILHNDGQYANRGNPPRAWRDKITQDDSMFYIYTSGTTGRSKAARFSHKRVYGAGVTWSHHMDLTERDRYYITLPLFHGNGGVVALAAVFHVGCTAIIREKFSASRFMADVRRYQCTATIYIGEIWRYICNQPRRSTDRDNTLRVIAGNGLNAAVWKEVQERFGVQKIVEHYGQTEMISAHPMINCYGRPGSCGFVPPSVWNRRQHPECLVKYDVENDVVMRDKDGFCIRCGPDEVGESLVDIHSTCGEYRGYTRPEENERKIYRNVFKKGDAYFHSGDLLRYDKEGFFYFVDRIGDTFRWKGENVSTSEVSEVVAQVDDILEANVYGVSVPGYDGRAGMASIVVREGDEGQITTHLDDVIQRVYEHTRKHLPSYALPLFLRVRTQRNVTTATFKFQKYQYQQDGIDLRRVNSQNGDLLFVLLHRNQDPGYVEMDDTIYNMIQQGEIRL